MIGGTVGYALVKNGSTNSDSKVTQNAHQNKGALKLLGVGVPQREILGYLFDTSSENLGYLQK